MSFSSQRTSITGRLLAIRLRWYGEATALLLRRRWQAILLWVGTLVPIGVSSLDVLSYPVLVILDAEHNFAWHFVLIVLWQGCWTLWTLMQRGQLRGGPFADYLQALPIRTSLRRRVDFVVLLLSDTPILVPFTAAGIALGMSGLPALGVLHGFLLIVFLLSTQLCAQHAVLDGRRNAVWAILVIDLWVAFTLGFPEAWAVMLMLPAVALSTGALVKDVPVPSHRVGFLLSELTFFVVQPLKLVTRALPPTIRISLGVLFRQHWSITLGTFFNCLLISFAAYSLMRIWQFDERCLLLVLIAFAVLALVISGLYRPLQMAHDAARPYTAGLPLHRTWSNRADTAALLGFSLPFAVFLTALLWTSAGLPALTAISALGSFLLLVALLRLPQLFSKKHAVVASAALTMSWTYAATQILHA